MESVKKGFDALQQPVTRATVLLAVICFLDTVYTLWAVRVGIAKEANPLMSSLLADGDLPFLVGKGLSFIAPLTLLELMRPKSPRFIPVALNLGAIGYLAVYVVGSIAIHV
jgi:hypothetical protein